MNTFATATETYQLPVPPANGFLRQKGNASVLGSHSDGTRVGYRYSETDRERFDLTLAPLTKYDLAAIKTFFLSTVGGKGLPFDWVDEVGVTRSVILSGPLTSGYLASRRFYLSFTLEEK